MNPRRLRWIAAGAGALACIAQAQTPAGSGFGGLGIGDLASVPGGETQAVAAAVAPEAAMAVTPTLRDPFWPVGYVPPRRIEKSAATTTVVRASATPSVPAPPANPVDWDEARRHIEVRGISRIAHKTAGRVTYFAVVNNKMIEEGDPVSVAWNGRVYRWRVTQIGPSGLQMVKLDSRPD